MSVLGHQSIGLTRSAGEHLTLPDHQIVVVRQGLLATWANHPDGDGALLDVSGAGQLVLGHGTDLCHIQHHALTDLELSCTDWARVSGSPEVADRLREQLRWREAWAAALAHPRSEDQVLALLELLATRFGTHRGHAVQVELALTHTQLAAATGRTRPTITRALQRLVRAGQVSVVGSRVGSRYVVAPPGRPVAGAASAVRHRP